MKGSWRGLKIQKNLNTPRTNHCLLIKFRTILQEHGNLWQRSNSMAWLAILNDLQHSSTTLVFLSDRSIILDYSRLRQLGQLSKLQGITAVLITAWMPFMSCSQHAVNSLQTTEGWRSASTNKCKLITLMYALKWQTASCKEPTNKIRNKNNKESQWWKCDNTVQ